MATLISHFGALGIVGAAAVSQFGWLRGLGVLAAVFLIMPEREIRE